MLPVLMLVVLLWWEPEVVDGDAINLLQNKLILPMDLVDGVFLSSAQTSMGDVWGLWRMRLMLGSVEESLVLGF
jgi:hypothetical protein